MGVEELFQDLYPGRRELARLASSLKVRVPEWVDATVPMLLHTVARAWEVRHLRPEAITRLAPGDREALVRLGDMGGIADEPDLSGRVDAATLERLEADAWIFRATEGAGAVRRKAPKGRAAWIVPEAVLAQLGVRAPEERLASRLLHLAPHALRRLEAEHGVESTARYPGLCALRRALLDPVTLRATMDALPPDSAEALTRLLDSGGWIGLASIRGEGASRRTRPLHPDEAVSRLLALGLVWTVENVHGEAAALELADEQFSACEAADPPRAAKALGRLTDEIATRLAGAERIERRGSVVLDDLRAVVSIVEGGLCRPTQSGQARSSDLRRLLPMLCRGSGERYAEFLWDLACRAGAVVTEAGVFRTGPGAEALLSGSPAEAVRALWRVWLADGRWSSASNDSPTWSDGLVNATRLRTSLFSVLARIRSDAWASIASLSAQLWAWGLHPNFGADRGRTELSREAEAILSGPANWLGAVDVAFPSTGDAPVAVQLTPLGRWLAGRGETPADIAAPQARTRQIVVQANLEIVAPPGLDPDVMRSLARFARPDGAGRFRLEPETVRAALDAGETAAGVLRFLNEYAPAGVPENVAAMIADWGARHGEYTVHVPELVVVARDGAGLDALAADPQFEGRLERVSDRVGLISGWGRDPRGVVARIRRRGYWAVAAERRSERRG